MKYAGVVSYSCSVLVFVLLAGVYAERIGYAGFAGGYVTDYARASAGFFQVAVWPFCGLGAYFFYLGRKAARRRVSTELVVAVSLLVLFVVAGLAVDAAMFLQLDHGQGG